MRQKKILPRVLDKYINFFYDLSDPAYSGTSLKYLVQSASINKSVIKSMKDLKIIEWADDNNWRLLVEEDFKKSALELLNYCLELGKKQIVTPIIGLDNEIRGYVKEIRDYLISNSQNKQSSLEGLKTGILSKALNQAPMNTNTLFSEVQSEQDKKFELLRSISGGVYQASLLYIMNSGDSASIETTNEFIILATEDLFNKFFKVK